MLLGAFLILSSDRKGSNVTDIEILNAVAKFYGNLSRVYYRPFAGGRGRFAGEADALRIEFNGGIGERADKTMPGIVFDYLLDAGALVVENSKTYYRPLKKNSGEPLRLKSFVIADFDMGEMTAECMAERARRESLANSACVFDVSEPNYNYTDREIIEAGTGRTYTVRELDAPTVRPIVKCAVSTYKIRHRYTAKRGVYLAADRMNHEREKVWSVDLTSSVGIARSYNRGAMSYDVYTNHDDTLPDAVRQAIANDFK